ncbi:MAG: GldG family protein [Catonella sp.]|nr:GldG family protein [Catonella sp.]MDY6357396.1 GldG family protein [Catonella sp.]
MSLFKKNEASEADKNKEVSLKNKPARTPEKKSAEYRKRVFKNGGYTTLITVFVVAVVIVLNLVVSNLGIQADMTEGNLYTLTDTSKGLLKKLDDNIDIYVLASESGADTRISKMIDEFTKISKKVKVEYKDPTVYPDFVKTYVDTTTTSVSQNSVIVVDETNGRSKFISAYDLVQTTFDQSTYQQKLSGYDVEGQITSAIQYVTSTTLPTVYYTTGHGESDLSESTNSYLKKQNVNVEGLATVSETEIPASCSALIINAPVNDFTTAETDMIKKYLENGGDAVITCAYTTNDMTNFESLLEYYGIKTVSGIVMEPDSDKTINGISYVLNPSVLSSDITSNTASNNKPLAFFEAVGLSDDVEVRSSVKVTGLLQTSDNAYSKTNLSSGTFKKEDADIAGPFYIGMSAEESVDNGTTHLIVYSSSSLTSAIDMNGQGTLDFTEYSSMGNLDLFTDSVNYVVDRTDSELTVPAKSFSQEYLAIPTSTQNFLMFLTIILLPLIVVGLGAIEVVKRRRL